MFSTVYRYMLAIAKYQNITKAATELCITQPALTKYLTRVESELGVVLFDRTTSPLTPTAAGKQFLKKAEQILDLEDSLLQNLKLPSMNLQGSLTFGITPEFSNLILPYILPDFIHTYPGIQIHIEEGSNTNLVSKLKRHKVELALITSVPLDHTIVFQNLIDDPIILAIPADHPIARDYDLTTNSPCTPYFLEAKRVRNADFIVCSPDLGIGAVTQEMFQKYHLNPHIVLTMRKNEVALKVASSGLGMTFTPVRTPMRIDLLHPMAYFSLDAPIYTRHRGICYPADVPLFRPAELFIETVKQFVSKEPILQNPVCQLIFQQDPSH